MKNSTDFLDLRCRRALTLFALLIMLSLWSVPPAGRAAETRAEVKNLSFTGGLDDNKAKLVIEADLSGLDTARAKPIYATALEHSLRATLEKLSHTFLLRIDVIQGEPKEIALVLSGEGALRSVTGDRLLDWSIREEAGGGRFLVLRPKPAPTPLTNWLVTVTAETEWKDLPRTITPLSIASPLPGLFQGFVRVDADPALLVTVPAPVGAVPIEAKYLPESLRKPAAPAGVEPLAFRIHDANHALPMTLSFADPELRQVVISDARLTGQFNDQSATFTFTATARVKNPQGGTLPLLSGRVALTDVEPHPGWRMELNEGRFMLVCEQPGEFPIKLRFDAGIHQASGWDSVDFRIAPGAVQPITLQGLAKDTQFDFVGAARPERRGADFVSFLPPDGAVKLAWKEARKAEEGKLFYAAEMLSQISVSPGVMRQVALLDFKVMQGELSRVVLRVRGAGEVTRVQGEQVLSWNVQAASPDQSDKSDRLLTVQLNQPQKDSFALQVQLQSPLGAFPQTAEAMRLEPEGATRYAGYLRIVNDGAVRLEVTQASGLSQISPEQFPESDATKAVLRATGGQRFAYRFSSADYALRVQADQIQPEVSVSELLAYHHGQNELAIDAEIELDVREAPLRELLLRIPRGYAIARLNASGMSDYFLTEQSLTPSLSPSDGERGDQSELRIVYGQPVSGRQVVQLRLERNKPLGDTNWTLPRIEVAKAKSVRGNVGVSADAGFRLTAERTQALTEIATAFFPRKVANLQAAFRISEANWSATMRVERLPQTITADGFHLFSIGEGIAYGSSVMNYLISGAPVSVMRVALSDEYFNVEFTGKDVRNWQKTTNGYVVQLHSPVAGAYTLLATYERPFKPQGETLTFTGAQPLDAQSESGHTLVISAYQFQVQPANVSTGLLPLEPGEVPAEHRLFFDAPILAAYRYTSRPFNLSLALSPLAQGDSLSQVVDRAALFTQITKRGEVVMNASYFVKNRGNPNFRLALPAGMQLWSATVNGAAVVPVKDGNANLIPLPQRADPNSILKLDLTLASTSAVPSRVTVSAPVVAAPVMLAEWKLEPEPGQRLVFVRGSLTPVGGEVDVSGFAQLTRMFSGRTERILVPIAIVLVLMLAALVMWRWAAGEGVAKFSARHVIGSAIGLAAVVMAAVVFAGLFEQADNTRSYAPRNLSFLAPVQQAGSATSIEVENVAGDAAQPGRMAAVWPVVLALIVWAFGWWRNDEATRIVAKILGWTLLAWAALRWPNGAALFLGVIAAFLVVSVIVPALRRLWSLPRKAVTENGTAPAVATVVIGSLLWSVSGGFASSQNPNGIPALSPELRGTSYPGSSFPGEFNANGVVSEFVMTGRNPVGVGKNIDARTQGSSSLATLGWKTQSLRDSGSLRSGVNEPLTPALSPGERENRSPSRVNVEDAPRTPVLLAALPVSGQQTRGDRTIGKRSLQSPLSGGEGQGEGKRDAQINSREILLAQVAPQEASTARSTTRSKLAPQSTAFAVADSIAHEFRVEEKFVFATAKIRWTAEKGQMLPLLFEPAVLTQLHYPSNALKLVQSPPGTRRAQQLLAERNGTFDLEVKYQMRVSGRDAESGFVLPTPAALVNRAGLTIANLDVDVFSPQVVTVQRDSAGSNTVASLVLAPVNDAWIGWKPRSRDVKREKAVFYAELSQLYAPSAGVIEGAHLVSIRPAQGELSELVFNVPAGATVTDVTDGSNANRQSLVWRFDPDARKLRVTLNPAQSRPFTLLVRSQVATGPLPLEQSVGLLSVEGAAGQIGVLGVATGNEVQLDNVSVESLSPINLEDFPADSTAALAAQISGLTVRRAFRYADIAAKALLKASPVEPDVRVEVQNTLSLGEDRTVLAANATVDITRAGIFKLSFVMPDGFDVEAISGATLSHWSASGGTGDPPVLSGDSPDRREGRAETQLVTQAQPTSPLIPVGGSPTGTGESPVPPKRLITLNLKGKTEGRQQFSINLSGPGAKATNAWSVPQLILREASKQQGTLVIVPEQGMQLQAATLDGISQLDPQKSGIRQKGVLAFRILQSPWNLALKIEQVDAWVQVTSLQHATVSEAQVKVAANLQYQIENTGLKSFRVWLPANAEGVRFNGEQVADFLQVAGATTNGLQQWEVKLQRRIIGQFLLQVNYQTLIADQATETALRGVQAADVNLQRGFVTVQAGGRLQVRPDEAALTALQPTEWQSIPRTLQQNMQAAAANFAYRLVEPGFDLRLNLDRHEAAKLLAARVQSVAFTSVISDDGVMLTQARLELLPGDKRLLAVKLPAKANFWFAFVNQNGVWPWREGDRILIPLEPQSRAGKATPVEVFYSSQVGQPGSRALDLELSAPKFDLPLENISWRVHLNDKWQVKDWSGTLQLSEEQIAPVAATLDLRKYLEGEVALQREKTQEAEQMLAFGNTALERGDPQQARRAFQSAYGLSTHDNAFNEDARVQLHNLKLQQALVGLNVRQAVTEGDTAALGGRFRDLRGAKELNYSQQDAKQIIDRNTADDNAATMRLAEKLIQQQDAAVTTAAAIRANIPEQGRVLTFQRSVAVDKEADLHINLKVGAAKAVSWGVRVLILGLTFGVLCGFGWAVQGLQRKSN